MRNGNQLWGLHQILPCQSSYPTYEEWKPGNALPFNQRTFSSYPTYEEWKQDGAQSNVIVDTRSVLILPMRNGNYDLLTSAISEIDLFLSYL